MDPIGLEGDFLKLYVNGLGWDDEAGWEPDADQGSHERRSVPRSYQTMSRPTLRRRAVEAGEASSQNGDTCRNIRPAPIQLHRVLHPPKTLLRKAIVRTVK